jgi:RHS repeat-associated protein
MSFDIFGRLLTHRQTTDGTNYDTAYAYNLGGALTEETYPSGRVVRNVLDANGDLAKVQSKKNSTSGSLYNYAFNFAYNAAGAVTSMELGNGRFESITFNSRLQPTQIALGTTTTSASSYDLLKLNYDYGTTANNGNVQSQTITVPTVGSNNGFVAVQNYSYDSLNRLKDATENVTPTGGSSSQSWKQTFTFDRYGNRNFDQANTTMPASFANPAVTNPTISTSNNRITSSGWTYDAAGNTLTDAIGQKFTYDGENKQTEVKNSSNATIGQYWYDGDGKRVKKLVPSTGETTIFVYDAAGKQIAEYSTIVASVEDAKVAYLTNDHLGSPRINTDRDGNVTSRHDYHPFGEEILTSQRTTGLNYVNDTVRKQFTGYERDNESELDFAQARMFASQLGRFSAADPYNVVLEKQSAENKSDANSVFQNYLQKPQVWNRYAYVMNNPYKFNDPSGEDGLVVVFTDYKIDVSGTGVPYLGHAGIVLIDEGGTATYYEYGRYDPEQKGWTQHDRKGSLKTKLEFTADGVATEESVKGLMAELSAKYGQNGAIEGAYFNTNQATTDAMKSYADGRVAQNEISDRKDYALFANNCMTFTRDVLQGGGVTLNTTAPLPGGQPTSQFGRAKAGGLEPSSSSARPATDIRYLQQGTYSIPSERRESTKPGRIPYKPSK